MYLLNSAGDTEQKERTSQQMPPQRQIPFEKYQVRLEYGALNFVKYNPHQSLTSAGPTGPVRNSLYDKWEDKSNPCLYLLLLLLYLLYHYCCIEHSVRHHFGYFIIYLFIYIVPSLLSTPPDWRIKWTVYLLSIPQRTYQRHQEHRTSGD